MKTDYYCICKNRPTWKSGEFWINYKFWYPRDSQTQPCDKGKAVREGRDSVFVSRAPLLSDFATENSLLRPPRFPSLVAVFPRRRKRKKRSDQARARTHTQKKKTKKKNESPLSNLLSLCHILLLPLLLLHSPAKTIRRIIIFCNDIAPAAAFEVACSIIISQVRWNFLVTSGLFCAYIKNWTSFGRAKGAGAVSCATDFFSRMLVVSSLSFFSFVFM